MSIMGLDVGSFQIVYMLLVWVVAVAAAIWLISCLFPRVPHDASSRATRQGGDRSESPLEILQQRYARGEISKTEYEAMRHDLEE
jgi:putative membrane protein